MQNSNAPQFILAQHLIEWFSCPLRSFHLIHNQCSSLAIASRYRENIRVLHTFLRDLKSIDIALPLDRRENAEQHAVKTPQESLIETKELFERNQPISEALFCIRRNILLFVPYMYWDNEAKGWVLWYGMASNSHKRESMLQAALMLAYAKEHGVSISKILCFAHNTFKLIDKQLITYEIKKNTDTIDSSIVKQLKHWRCFDITKKTRNYATQEKNEFKNLFAIIEKEDAFTNKQYWKGCNRQYCESCATEEQYAIDDIRTIRKSKHLTDELYKDGIRKITELPSGIPFETAAYRQIQSVKQNRPILYTQEIKEMLHSMHYPRYYLDFEAFNSSVPSFHKTNAWEYVPFLFSLQWQSHPQGKVHTQLWAMPPAVDKRKDMWDILKQHLDRAGSIIVYSSQFEDAILKKLSELSNEYSVYQELRSKIVDLQTLFFNLSLYHPKQKGKISLKTVADVWLTISYSNFTVSEGIAANYYYATFCDEAQHIFDTIKQSPYLSLLFGTLRSIEDSTIVLKDIMEYCKYDTKVMVHIVHLLEDSVST